MSSRLATQDALTGLSNRALFDDRLTHALIGSTLGARDVAVAVMVLDLDQFKTINDTHGHQVGDELPVQVANRLRAQARSTDMVRVWVETNSSSCVKTPTWTRPS